MAVDRQSKPSGAAARRWLVGSNVALTVVLALALVGAVQWGAYRIGGKSDWTSSGVNSLSNGTRALLNGLQSPVRITTAYFETNIEEEDQAKYRNAVRDLVELFQIENRSRIEIDSFNPLEDHGKRQALIERLSNLPEFKEQADGHRAQIDRFKSEYLPRIFATIDTELDLLGTDTGALGATESTQVAGQLRILLERSKRDLQDIQEAIQDATTGTAPRLSAATTQVHSAYSEMAGFFKQIIDVGNKVSVSASEIDQQQKDYFAGADQRLSPVVADLEKEAEVTRDLQPLDLDDVLSQLAPNANAIVVETDQSATVVPFQNIWPPLNPAGGGQSMAFKDRAFKGEEKIASAILQLTQKQTTAVVFVRHGGPPLFAGGMMPGQPQPIMGQVKSHLEDLNFDLYEWDLANQPAAPKIDPEPARTIFVVMKPAPSQRNPMLPPQQQPPQFGPQQKQAVLDAIGENGRAIFVASWAPGMFGVMPAAYEFEDTLANQWGLDVDGGVLLLQWSSIEPGKYAPGRAADLMTGATFSDHVIVERLSALPTAFPTACPMTLTPEAPEGVKRQELVRLEARDGLWGIKDLEPYRKQAPQGYWVKEKGDLEGPFTIAAAAEKGEAKVVVICSQQFCWDSVAFSRQLVQTANSLAIRTSFPGNLTLLVNSLHWLNDNEEIMNLGQPIDASSLDLAEGPTLSVLRAVAWGIWPGVILLGGAAVWFVRRR